MTKAKKTVHKNDKVELAVNGKMQGWFSLAVFILVAILVAYPVFFRGLFFSEDIFIYHIVTAVVFLLVCIDKIYRQDYAVLNTPLDWAVLSYALAFLLSLIGAIHPGEAFYGFLKALNWFMVFWVVSRVVRDYRSYTWLLNVILLAGVGVAMIGLLSATGIYKYPSAFDGKVIMSTLQYRNACAAYLAAITLLAATLGISTGNRILKPLYSLAAYLLLLVIIGTMSKGVWIVLSVFFLIFIAGVPGLKRLSALYFLFISGLAAALTAVKFIPAVTGGQTSATVSYLFIGLIVVLIGEIGWDIIIRANRRWGWQKTAAMVLVLLLVLLATLATMKVGDQSLAAKAKTTIASMNMIPSTTGFSYESRHMQVEWGLKIFKDNMLNGAGAGAWNALYHRYQDCLFWTTETHNHFLQLAIETGILGLSAFLAMWGVLLFVIVRRGKLLFAQDTSEISPQQKNNWILNWGVACAALFMGVHAFFDFDLSLGAMVVLLWTLMALVNTGAVIDGLFKSKTSNTPWLLLTAGILLTALLLITGARDSMAYKLFVNSDKLMQTAAQMKDGPEKEKRIKQVQEMSEQAEKLDPNNARYPAVFAQASALRYMPLVNAKDSSAVEIRDTALKAIQRTEKLAPYDIKVRGSVINTAMMLQDFDIAVHNVNFLTEANPLDANAYDNVVMLSIMAADNSLQKGDTPKAKTYLENSLNTVAKMAEQREKLNPGRLVAPYWQNRPLEFSSRSFFGLGKASYLLGKYPEAEGYFKKAIDNPGDLAAEINPVKAWYLASQYKNGKQAEADLQLQQGLLNQQDVSLYNQLKAIQSL